MGGSAAFARSAHDDFGVAHVDPVVGDAQCCGEFGNYGPAVESVPRGRGRIGDDAGFTDAKISVVVTRHNVDQLDEFKAPADRFGVTPTCGTSCTRPPPSRSSSTTGWYSTARI
jgi:hypothetical protein